MSAYRSPGRLSPAAQRLDLLQVRADRRRAAVSQPPEFGDCGWFWTDLKAPAAGAGSERGDARRPTRELRAVRDHRWHA